MTANGLATVESLFGDMAKHSASLRLYVRPYEGTVARRLLRTRRRADQGDFVHLPYRGHVRLAYPDDPRLQRTCRRCTPQDPHYRRPGRSLQEPDRRLHLFASYKLFSDLRCPCGSVNDLERFLSQFGKGSSFLAVNKWKATAYCVSILDGNGWSIRAYVCFAAVGLENGLHQHNAVVSSIAVKSGCFVPVRGSCHACSMYAAPLSKPTAYRQEGAAPRDDATVSRFEQMLVDSGIRLLKYYLDISEDEQKSRLADRKRDPLKQWKSSPIDDVAIKHWDAYTQARDAMLLSSHTTAAPIAGCAHRQQAARAPEPDARYPEPVALRWPQQEVGGAGPQHRLRIHAGLPGHASVGTLSHELSPRSFEAGSHR